MSGTLSQPEIPKVPPPDLQPDAGNALTAEKEAGRFAARNLDAEAKELEHERSQKLKWHVHIAAKFGVWFVFCLGVVGATIFAFHELAPTRLCWLTTEQLGTLRTFLFSSAATSAAGVYLKQRL